VTQNLSSFPILFSNGSPPYEHRCRLALEVVENVQGSVAKTTHAGIPWLRYIRQHNTDRVHFWPFDGWSVPPNRSAVVGVYPALWSREYGPVSHL
jgi:hypothetical protein